MPCRTDAALPDDTFKSSREFAPDFRSETKVASGAAGGEEKKEKNGEREREKGKGREREREREEEMKKCKKYLKMRGLASMVIYTRGDV